jgi:hypothetical protein
MSGDGRVDGDAVLEQHVSGFRGEPTRVHRETHVRPLPVQLELSLIFDEVEEEGSSREVGGPGAHVACEGQELFDLLGGEGRPQDVVAFEEGLDRVERLGVEGELVHDVITSDGTGVAPRAVSRLTLSQPGQEQRS